MTETASVPSAGAEADDQWHARFVRVLESLPGAFLSLDADGHLTYVNAEAQRLLAAERESLLGRLVWECLPQSVHDVFTAKSRAARTSGAPETFEAWFPEPVSRWLEVRVWPDDGELAAYFLDVTPRVAAAERSAHAAQRARLLATITAEMAGTLDADEGAARLARAVVPDLADWCVVTLVDEDDDEPLAGLRDAAAWHRDPAGRTLTEEYRTRRLPALGNDSHLAEALATGQPVVVPTAACRAIVDVVHDPHVRDVLSALAPESAAWFLLPGRDRVVGALSLFRGEGRPAMGSDDLALADEAAVRAGLALDNARSFRRQQQLAEAFQRALLTPPPEPDHMQVVVRYAPAAEAAQVGGDWYDSFIQRDGSTVLVIGDVIGHDAAAAAAMGQLRSLLRGIAAHTGEGPADVLRGMDQVMALLEVDTTATAVVARIEQTADERARGVTHVRWSNAGHPPPMAINPNGTVVVLSGVEPDLLLGIDPSADRTESSITVDRGSTLLMYTDGLVERRGQSLDEGLGRLRDVLVEVASADLDHLCDEVLRRMLPPQSEDDVALVAVRLHRQDRPRPPEAGPQRVPDEVKPSP